MKKRIGVYHFEEDTLMQRLNKLLLEDGCGYECVFLESLDLNHVKDAHVEGLFLFVEDCTLVPLWLLYSDMKVLLGCVSPFTPLNNRVACLDLSLLPKDQIIKIKKTFK